MNNKQLKNIAKKIYAIEKKCGDFDQAEKEMYPLLIKLTPSELFHVIVEIEKMVEHDNKNLNNLKEN